ncbi:MAG TPA: hypothetical protein PL187_00200 [Caldilinea sp.]|nr:hypothetical protein [Caldilinea sp.]
MTKTLYASLLDALRGAEGADVVVLPVQQASALASMIESMSGIAVAIERAAQQVAADANYLIEVGDAVVLEQPTEWSAQAPVGIAWLIADLDRGEDWTNVPPGLRQRIVDYVLDTLARRYDRLEEAMQHAPSWLPTWTSLYRSHNARWRSVRAGAVRAERETYLGHAAHWNKVRAGGEA